MTIIEAMKVLLAASGHEDWYEFAPAERHIITIAAQGTIGRLVSGYERLAPDWSQAPEWAQWYAIIDQHKLARPAIQPGSPEAKALSKEIKATTWADRRIDPTYPEPPTKSQISGCVDTLAWEAALGSDEKRLAHMSAPENFQYYLDGVRQRLDFPINHYSVKDALAAHIERLRNTLAVVPEPKTITDPVKEITVDGDRPLPKWTQPDPVDHNIAIDAQPAPPRDDRRARLAHFAVMFQNALDSLPHWADLTGRNVLTGEAERGLRKLLDATRNEIAAINGQSRTATWGDAE